MRTLVIAVALAACTVDVSKTSPPVAGGAGVNVDSAQRLSVDDAKVPLLTSCGTGQVVRKASAGWECADAAGLRVDYGSLVNTPLKFPPNMDGVRVKWSALDDVPPKFAPDMTGVSVDYGALVNVPDNVAHAAKQSDLDATNAAILQLQTDLAAL